MRSIEALRGLVMVLLLIATPTVAQEEPWVMQSTDDGEIVVESRIYEQGEDLQIIEYIVTTSADVTLDECIRVLKNVENHKIFMDDQVSKVVKVLSDNEWVIYYYTDSPWPMPDSDCVSRMKFIENMDDGVVRFHINAAPSDYPESKVKRMSIYNVSYDFKSTATRQVEIVISAKMSPVIQAPMWLVKSMFPEGPADVARKIIKLTESV